MCTRTGRCRLKRLPVLIHGELMKVRPECKAGCTPGQLWRRWMRQLEKERPLFRHESACRSHTVERYCGRENAAIFETQLQHARCTTHATSPYNLLLPQIASTRRCAMSQMVRTSKLECHHLLVPVCETQSSSVSGPARPPGRGTSSLAHEDGRPRPHHSHHRHIPLVLQRAGALVATQHGEVSVQHMIAASDISGRATCRCLIQVQQLLLPHPQ